MNKQTAIWCCAECGNVVRVTFPTYYFTSRWCNHWTSSNKLHMYLMTPMNDIARTYDKFEAEKHVAMVVKQERERVLTEERADWRFGCV